MTQQYTFTRFTPAEAERITGLPTVTQRDWRRRGFLPGGAGHARFDIFDVAEMLVLRIMSDRGIGPQQAKDVSQWCADGIVYQCLLDIGAYEGDHHQTLHWLPAELRPRPRSAAERREVINSEFRRVYPSASEDEFGKLIDSSGVTIEGGEDWQPKGEWLALQIARQRGGYRLAPPPFFIWWADGSHVWHTSLDRAFSEVPSFDGKVAGPVIVLDLKGLAGLLSDRVARAVVRVEFAKNPKTGGLLPPIEFSGPAP